MNFLSPRSKRLGLLPRWYSAFAILIVVAYAVSLVLSASLSYAGDPARTSGNEAKAAHYFSDKSYAQAADIWATILEEEKPRRHTSRWRELTFRICDAKLRSYGKQVPDNQQAALQHILDTLQQLTKGVQPVPEDETPNIQPASTVTVRPDASPVERGMRGRQALVPQPVSQPGERGVNLDIWAALANESLGDYYLLSNSDIYNYVNSRPNYYFARARTWWAEQDQSEEARVAWLRLYFKPLYVKTEGHQLRYIQWDLATAEMAVRLATGKYPFKKQQYAEEEAAARYTYIMSLIYGNNTANTPVLRKRLLEAIEPALALGKKSGWNDNLLFALGQFYERCGELAEVEPGIYNVQPDYITALKYYRRVIAEFTEGETPLYQQAQSSIKAITEPRVSAGNNSAFQPGSYIQYQLYTRNVDKVELSIRKLDYVVAMADNAENRLASSHGDKPRYIPPGIGEEVRKWTYEPKPRSKFEPTNESQMTDPLPGGAYWLETRSGNTVSGSFLFVSNTTVSVVQGLNKLVAYVSDATTGLPKANATVAVHTIYLVRHSRDEWDPNERAKTVTGITNEDGLVEIVHPSIKDGEENKREILVVAMANGEPAMASLGGSMNIYRERLESKAYVYTDSPAYKPGDTVKFRVIYREHDGSAYQTTPGKKLKVTVHNPKGEGIAQKSYDLNEYGSLTDSFTLPKDTPLGPYMVRVETQQKDGRSFSHSAELFRIEEFKLPEFRVEVKVPEKDGRPAIFRPGEKIRAEVKVAYYSGGAVAGGDVEYDISLAPYYGDNPWPQAYPWFYRGIQSSNPWMRYYGDDNGMVQNIISRGTAKTDNSGVAYIELDTQASLPGAVQYNFAVRVTDASRRMVVGNGSIKVSPAPYFIHIKSNSQVYEPGATATLQGKAVDANGCPVEMKGTLTLNRKHYVRKVAQNKEGKVIRVVFNGYETKQIEQQEIATDKDGAFNTTVKVPEEGYYTISVVSPSFDKKNSAAGDQNLTERVKGEATFFAADKATKSLGYVIGNLQIIPDKVTYRVGETARLIVIAPQGGGAALFSVHGTDLLSYQLVRMNGMAKLVEVPVTSAHQPNALLTALMIRNGRMEYAQEEIVVPPDDHFLNFALSPEQKDLRPGQKGAWTVRVTDSQGKPVQTEVSLGVVDAAIYSIQQDLSGDIRQFFYGEKRTFYPRNSSSLGNRSIINIAKPKADDETIVESDTPSPEELASLLSPQTRDLRRIIEDEDIYVETAQKGVVLSGYVDTSYSYAFGRTRPGASTSLRGAPTYPVEESDFLGVQGEAQFEKRTPSSRSGPYFKQNGRKAGTEESIPDQALVVRSDFRVSAFWDGAVKTDADGKARVEVTYPESLTEWKAVARGVTRQNQFGFGDGIVRTAQPLMVRLQTPRFVVEGDRFTLTSVINNETDKSVSVKTKIEARNLESIKTAPDTITLQPRAQGRVDAEFEAKLSGGAAEITASGTSPTGSDGMRLPLPIVEHGIEKFIARSFLLDVAPDATGQPVSSQADIILNVPEKRNPGTTRLDFILTPSLASTCLDALPYLANYPYGCVEQTMSRFLPACVASRTLKELNLEPEYVAGRLFGGMEAGSARVLQMNKGDLSKLDEMTKTGIARLADMQHQDGGWGWWKDGNTDDYMTAYVVQGLALARKAGVSVPETMLKRGAEYLKIRLVHYKQDPDNAAWLLYAISLSNVPWDTGCEIAATQAYENRQSLNAYTRSLLALALWEKRPGPYVYGSKFSLYVDWAKILVENLENGVQEVKADSDLIGKAGSATMPGTCYWGESAINHRWQDGSVETTAMALRAMIAIDPQNKRVDQAARWLINNRRGAQWKNTKDTATVILSMLDYIRANQEGETDLAVDVLVNGEVVKTVNIGKAESLGTLPLNIPDSRLKTGDNKVTVKVSGKGRLYVSAYLRYFTREEPITAAGNEVYVKREYFRATSVPRMVQGLNTTLAVLKDGDEVVSGDKIIVKLTLEAKNNYEYLCFEDKKPAGFEAVQVKSGVPVYARADTGDGLFSGASTWMNQEMRDQHVAFFITSLAKGKHQITYELRAETPGKFHGLPTLGHAMYVPEIRCNSDEFRITVTDKPDAKR
ncbi:MAG: alpha-2-macroglobulin [Candidatus Methylacidiphilales bacterium]